MASPGGRPRRSLGQNFLTDPNTARRVVSSLDLAHAERIVEIGPGRGALTEGLLELGLPLYVIEKDRKLAQVWETRAKTLANLRAIEGDVLKEPLEQFGPPHQTVVVGNIPYNVTTPLIFHLLERPRPLELVLMVQREVADRLAATEGVRAYGALTVGVQSVATVQRLFNVPRTVFRPKPRVDSAVVKIVPDRPPQLTVEHEEKLRVVVRACFGWRRKQMGTILRKHPDLSSLLVDETGVEPRHEDAVALLRTIGVEPTARPETLSPGQFAELAGGLG